LDQERYVLLTPPAPSTAAEGAGNPISSKSHASI
jgi:hypothetical protein